MAAKSCHLQLSRPHWCSVQLSRAPDRTPILIHEAPETRGTWAGPAHFFITGFITSLSLQRLHHASSLTRLRGYPRLKLRYLRLMQQKCLLPPSNISRMQLNNSTLPAISSLLHSSKILKLWPPCTLAPQNHVLLPRLMLLLSHSCSLLIQNQGWRNLQFTIHLYKNLGWPPWPISSTRTKGRVTYLGNFRSRPHCSLCSTVRHRAYLPRCRILHRRFAPSTQHRSAQPSAWRASILLLLLCAGPSARTTSAPPIYTHTLPLSLPPPCLSLRPISQYPRSPLHRRCRLAPQHQSSCSRQYC